MDAIFRRFSADLIDVMKLLYTPAEIAEAKDEAEKAKVQEPEKKLTKEDIRAVLLQKSREGWKEQVKAILDKYSKNGTLTGVSEDSYNILLREVRWNCHETISKEEVAGMVDAVKTNGNGSVLPGLFEHHYATCLDDLKQEYYPSFMRDAEVYADA
jgi:FtsZ-binding cell division protein ZapB